jgi:hypothetical protein
MYQELEQGSRKLLMGCIELVVNIAGRRTYK